MKMANTNQIRDISALTKTAQTAFRMFKERCQENGLDFIVTETYRSQERQNYLYEQGRTRPGKWSPGRKIHVTQAGERGTL